MAKSVVNTSGQGLVVAFGNAGAGYEGKLIPGYGGAVLPTTINELREWRAPAVDVADTVISNEVGKFVSSGNATVVPETDAPDPVSGLTITTDEEEYIQLNWTNPSNSDLFFVVVVRKEGSGFTSLDDESLELVLLDDSVQPGAPSVFYDDDVSDGVVYYYGLLTYDTAGHCGLTFTLGVNYGQGMMDAPPDIVRDLGALTNADGYSDRVRLTWTNPDPVNNDLADVRLLRRTDTYPTAYNDSSATLVYQNLVPVEGGTETVNETGLSAGTYYYAVFCADTAGHWSTTVMVGLNAAVAIVTG